MPAPQIDAIIDHNIIRVNYLYSPGLNQPNIPVDLIFRYLYLNPKSDGSFTEVEFNRTKVASAHLNLSGIPGINLPEQTAKIQLLNPTYRKNVQVEVIEDRGSGPLSYRAMVKLGDQSGDKFTERTSNPSNPAREQIDETLPSEMPERATDNIVVPEVEIRQNILNFGDFSFTGLPKNRFDAETDLWVSESLPNVIENGVVNLISNANFNYTTENYPSGFNLEGPGLLLFGKVVKVPNWPVNYWRMRASNPNWVNAFGKVSWNPLQTSAISAATQMLTYSWYQRVYPEAGDMPVHNIICRFVFLDSNEAFISSVNKTMTVDPSRDWKLTQFSVTSNEIPVNAAFVRPVVDTNALEGPDFFIWDVQWPQLEEQRAASSRVITSRPDDFLVSRLPTEFGPKYRAQISTVHQLGIGLRSLLSNTHLMKNGIVWTVSSERMFLKVYDSLGNVAANAYSPIFSKSHLSPVKYGLKIQNGSVDFEVDGTVIGSSPIVVPATTWLLKIGCSETSGATVHAKIDDFLISRIV